MADAGAAGPADRDVAGFGQLEQAAVTGTPADGHAAAREGDLGSVTGRPGGHMRREGRCCRDARRARGRGAEDLGVHPRAVDAQVDQGGGPEVAFARSGLTIRWGTGYASLLELAEACDVPVRWSCRTGVCHTCETALMSGTVSYSPDPVDEPAEGSTLICCSQPSADLILDL